MVGAAGAGVRTLPSVSSTSRAPRWRQTLRKARGRAVLAADRRRRCRRRSRASASLPGSATAEAWPTQTQPRKSVVELPVEHGRVGERRRRQHRRPLDRLQRRARRRAGRGAAVRCWCQARSSTGFLDPRRQASGRCVDLVVNRMLVCRADGGQVARHEPWRTAAIPFELDERALDAPGAGAALRRGRADAARGGGRARAAASFPTSRSPTVKRAAIEAGLDGGLHAPRARRPGLDAGSSGRWSRSSTGARRTRSTGTCRNAYNVWAHAIRRAGRPLPAPGAARRAQGRLRGHRARRRLGPLADRGDRRAHRRRLPDQRREVVRDRAATSPPSTS